jgi:hypothetical protein
MQSIFALNYFIISHALTRRSGDLSGFEQLTIFGERKIQEHEYF